MNVYILILVVIIVLIVLLVKRKRSSVVKNYPPGYNGLPLFGVLPFLGENPAESFTEWAKKLGPIFYVKFGTKTMVLLNDYESIHHFLVMKGRHTSDHPAVKFFNDAVGRRGLAFHQHYDESYKEIKKFVITSLKRIDGDRGIAEQVNKEMPYLMDVIDSHKTLDIRKAISTCLGAILSKSIFGRRFEYNDKNILELSQTWHKLFNNKVDGIYINLLILYSSLKYIPIFSGVYRRFANTVQTRKEIIRKIITEHLSGSKTSDDTTNNNVIDLFFINQKKDQSNMAYENQELPAILNDLFDGGQATAAMVISWCLMYLAKDKKTQELIYNELQGAIKNENPNHNHKSLTHLTASFIDEIMRHRTVLPYTLQHTSKEINAMGYTIPKGTTILVNFWALHNHTKYFSTPEKIIPDRFVDKETGKFVRSRYVIPFGLGLRKCPGYKMAEKQVYILLSNIVLKYEVEEDPQSPLPDICSGNYSFLYSPNDFKLRFKRRKQ